MTSLARMSTSSFPTLDSSIPSRSRSSTLESLSRSRNPSTSQVPIISSDEVTRPSMPRRSSSVMHREVLTRLRPLPFQYIWCAWHSKPTISPASTPNEDVNVPASPTYALTLLSPEVRDIAAFYRIFNNTPWTTIKAKESVHFFRAGVKPLWEDPHNRDGGCWVLKVRKEDGRAQKVWEECCVLALGGELQSAVAGEHDHVLGLSYSPRLYQAHISIWTQNGANMESREKLQRAVIQGLTEDLRPNTGMEYYYKMHKDHEGFEEAVGKGNANPVGDVIDSGSDGEVAGDEGKVESDVPAVRS